MWANPDYELDVHYVMRWVCSSSLLPPLYKSPAANDDGGQHYIHIIMWTLPLSVCPSHTTLTSSHVVCHLTMTANEKLVAAGINQSITCDPDTQ